MIAYVYNCYYLHSHITYTCIYIPTYMTKFMGIYVQICIYHILGNII